MSTITTIAGTDLITNSRTDINTNFSNLNTDKIETSYLDTDTSLAANSDTKIATQKAVKTYIDTSGGANASETVRGIVEEATDAEVTAGTATGGTGAKLVVTPAKLATRLASLKQFGDGSDGNVTISGTTTLTSDMYYNDLVVTGTLKTAGYRVFVKGTLSGAGTIECKGVAATNASGMTGGGGGSAVAAGYFSSVAGQAGANGNTSGQIGDNGVAGTSVSNSIGVIGAVGGDGGNTSGGAQPGGAAGTVTASLQKFGITLWQTVSGLDVQASGTPIKYTGSSGSGSGAAGDSAPGIDDSGGGGGSGSPGGIILFLVNTWAGTFTINISGGNGGNGGNGVGSAGGGGGGAGGSGGVSVFVYGTKTWTGSYTKTGGTGGAGGSGAQAGVSGSTGTTGLTYEIGISTLL